MIHHINKRIDSRISSIGVLRVNNTSTQLRIRTLDFTIHSLDDIRDQMDEIDINFVRTRKDDYLDIYEKLNWRYMIEKSGQYPLFSRWQKWKKMLLKEEKEKVECENKCEFLQNYSKKIEQEIQSIKLENESLANENLRIRNRIIDVKKVPTITDYAHIIAQTKKLQHEVHIWSQRVDIAQVCFSFFVLKFYLLGYSIRHYWYN